MLTRNPSFFIFLFLFAAHTEDCPNRCQCRPIFLPPFFMGGWRSFLAANCINMEKQREEQSSVRNGRQECCCLSRLIVTHEWEIFGSRLAHGEYSEYQRSTAVVLLVLTQYDNQADEYGPQCAHAQLQALPLLDELTVLAPVSSGQMHRYRRRGSRLMQVAPFRQGRSKHSLRSTQPLVSEDMMRPSLQLKWNNRNFGSVSGELLQIQRRLLSWGEIYDTNYGVFAYPHEK